MSITTHVLDTARGKPAAAVPIRLSLHHDGGWKELGHGATDDDGRCRTLLPPGKLVVGTYRLTFEVAAYFAAQGTASFYPKVSVHFEVTEAVGHYHVPLLLSPWGYSTYRGS
jgi:5-hydroxyisourate hydrolase